MEVAAKASVGAHFVAKGDDKTKKTSAPPNYNAQTGVNDRDLINDLFS